jgi:hypothetical protein
MRRFRCLALAASAIVHFRFIATFKLPFKFAPQDRGCPGPIRSPDTGTGCGGHWGGAAATKKREAVMTELGFAVAQCAEPADADACFTLGMICSAGAGTEIDLVQAHKWFNIAAMRGHADAARLRREIAEQMSDSEIGLAQRAARDWLKAHTFAPAQQPALRTAA